jgi:hypothetical protein
MVIHLSLWGERNMSTLRDFPSKTLFIWLLVGLVSLLNFPSNGYGDDWVLIKKDDKISKYYNASSIKIDKENRIINVWVKKIYSEKGRIDYLKDLGSIKQSYYKDIKIDLYLLLLNYQDLKFSQIYLKQYSKSGEELFDHEYPIKWYDIEKNSEVDLLTNMILSNFKIKR